MLKYMVRPNIQMDGIHINRKRGLRMIIGLKEYPHNGHIRVEDPTNEFYELVKKDGRLIAESKKLQPRHTSYPFLHHAGGIPEWIEVTELH